VNKILVFKHSIAMYFCYLGFLSADVDSNRIFIRNILENN